MPNKNANLQTKSKNLYQNSIATPYPRLIMTLRYLLIILLYTCLAIPASAGEAMKNITIHDGLAGETVFNIFKSKWNVIWVATSNGLSSYDGFYIRAIRVDERNSKIAIKDIAQGSDGYIWAATAEGLYVVDGTNTKLKRVLPDIKGNLTCMKIDGDRLFCGSEDGLYVASASRKEKEVRRVWLS